jgi:hypothetical protein
VSNELFGLMGGKTATIRDFGLKPPEARLTARVKTLRLAAGYIVIVAFLLNIHSENMFCHGGTYFE